MTESDDNRTTSCEPVHVVEQDSPFHSSLGLDNRAANKLAQPHLSSNPIHIEEVVPGDDSDTFQTIEADTR